MLLHSGDFQIRLSGGSLHYKHIRDEDDIHHHFFSMLVSRHATLFIAQRKGLFYPVLYLNVTDVLEVLDVLRHHDHILCNGCAPDKQIEVIM